VKQKYLWLGFFILLSSSASAQKVDVRKLSRLHLSKDLRVRLAERLSLFIEYEMTEQYEKEYDLLATRCPEGYSEICAVIPKDEYVKWKRKERESYGTLLELKFEGVYGDVRDNCVFPTLIPKFRKGKAAYSNASSAIACLQDGDWYFRFDLIEI
jgi:hypothetical protein